MTRQELARQVFAELEGLNARRVDLARQFVKLRARFKMRERIEPVAAHAVQAIRVDNSYIVAAAQPAAFVGCLKSELALNVEYEQRAIARRHQQLDQKTGGLEIGRAHV